MTNPARFRINGELVIGSDGENIKDIGRYTEQKEKVDYSECAK